MQLLLHTQDWSRSSANKRGPALYILSYISYHTLHHNIHILFYWNMHIKYNDISYIIDAFPLTKLWLNHIKIRCPVLCYPEHIDHPIFTEGITRDLDGLHTLPTALLNKPLHRRFQAISVVVDDGQVLATHHDHDKATCVWIWKTRYSDVTWASIYFVPD